MLAGLAGRQQAGWAGRPKIASTRPEGEKGCFLVAYSNKAVWVEGPRLRAPAPKGVKMMLPRSLLQDYKLPNCKTGGIHGSH